MINRMQLDTIDSYDEELEQELDDNDLLEYTINPQANSARVKYFRELFRLQGEKWIAGEGPERKQLQKKYPNAKWFGWLTGDELAALYRTADVFVFPSRTDTFGLVMIEAMACGTPVAAYPVTGPIDVVKSGESGYLNEDLKTAVMQCLKLDRNQVAEEAKKFSWINATKQFFAALRPIPNELK